MNIAITSKCNKGCSYCFARESMDIFSKTSDSVMTIKTFESILKKHDGPVVKILGGEPTQHPDFEGILKSCERFNKKATLISNFLFDDKTLEIIKKNIDIGIINGFLINSTDLDVGKRMENFSKNFNDLYLSLYPLKKEHMLSCGITIDQDKDEKYYFDYINMLSENLVAIERMRLSLNFPGSSNNKNDFYFLNNKNLGKVYFSIVKHLVDIGIPPSCDCIIYPCMFENREIFKYVKKFVEKTKSSCWGAPFDVFLDKSVTFCYPTKDSIKINFDNYISTSQMQDDLSIRQKAIKNLNKKNIPKQCFCCEYYKDNVCDGPCLGFYNLEEIKIGNVFQKGDVKC